MIVVICIILLLLLLFKKTHKPLILIDNRCVLNETSIEEVPNSPFSSEPNKKLSSSDILFLNSAKQRNTYDISKTLEDNLTNLLSTDHEYLVN